MVRRSSGMAYSPRPRAAVQWGQRRLTPLLGVLVALLLFWDVAGPLGAWKYHRLRIQQDRLIAANIEMAKENAALASRIERLKRDRSFQEEVVRHRLGWIKEGELLYKFVPARR